jgi:hypothetical protein
MLQDTGVKQVNRHFTINTADFQLVLHTLLAKFVDRTFIRKPFSSIYWRYFHSSSDGRDTTAHISEVEYFATYYKQLPFGIMYPVWLNPEYSPSNSLFPPLNASPTSTMVTQTVEQLLIKLLEKNPNCDVKGCDSYFLLVLMKEQITMV